jgi:hypothetical protein
LNDFPTRRVVWRVWRHQAQWSSEPNVVIAFIPSRKLTFSRVRQVKLKKGETRFAQRFALHVSPTLLTRKENKSKANADFDDQSVARV